MGAIAIPGAILPALQAVMEGAPVFNANVDDECLCVLLKDARAD